ELEPLISDDLYLIILNGDFNLNSENVFTVASNQSNSIAAREVFYFNYDGYKTSLILEAIKNDETLDCQNPFVENLTNKFLTPDEFANEFDSNAIANLEKLVSNIDIVLPDNNEISIIKYENNLNLTSKDYLIKITNENLEKYLLANSELDKQVYRQRLNFELEVINNKKFEDYFLVVQDFINFAKNNHIMTGPGRGSAAGSLVAFVLGITKIDPIKYNLLFERFLNIERVNMPDIDTDVMDTKREEIIDYIFEKYGKNHTAHIITFSKIKAKQAIRDIGRVFNVDLNIINKICKNIKPEFEDNIIDAIVNENK
ncbi:DNA polymerase III subunit alpha, partial [bacterium]|nr:DNA polymerase III subunit alpha [bacterium]